MTPGPTIIRRCAACAGLLQQRTLNSGNTFGATFWTDGFRAAPMLPDMPAMVLCPHCRAAVWIRDLARVGEEAPWKRGASFPEALAYLRPGLDDLLGALAAAADDAEKVRYLRTRAWWCGNDPRRAGADAPLDASEVANLEALLPLLATTEPGDRLMKAEALRELGRFDEAVEVLAAPIDDRYAAAADRVRALAREGDRLVRVLRPR